MKTLKQIFPKISVPIVFAFSILTDIFFWFYKIPEKAGLEPLFRMRLLNLVAGIVFYLIVAQFFLWFTRKAQRRQKIYLWTYLGLIAATGILNIIFDTYYPRIEWVFFGLAVIFLILSLKAARFGSSDLPQS